MTGKAIRGAGIWCLLLVVLALVSALSSSPAHAADPQPVLVYQNPAEGEVIQQPAFGIQLCFASPVNFKDLDKGGDFVFALTEPDGLGLGSRDVFQPDGYGVTVYPGHPIGEATGQWKFHYRITSPDAQSALEGDINYTVDPNGTPVPQATPPSCVGPGGTATSSPISTPTSQPTETPAVTASPGEGTATPVGASASPSASATPTSPPIVVESGDSSDTLTYVLVAGGIAGIAGVLVVIGLLMRRRRGDATSLDQE
jgi:hypothetical protein